MRRAMLALSILGLTPACATTHSTPHAPTSPPASASSPAASPASSTPSAPAANATLTGNLLAVGGPAPGSPRLLPGSVTITGPVTQHVAIGSDGRYRAVLPAGTYTVTGTSPQYNDGASNCRTDADTVTVTGGQTVAADVLCEEK